MLKKFIWIYLSVFVVAVLSIIALIGFFLIRGINGERNTEVMVQTYCEHIINDEYEEAFKYTGLANRFSVEDFEEYVLNNELNDLVDMKYVSYKPFNLSWFIMDSEGNCAYINVEKQDGQWIIVTY